MYTLRCAMRWTRDNDNHCPTVRELASYMKVGTGEVLRRCHRLRDYGFIELGVGNRVVILRDDQRRVWERTGPVERKRNCGVCGMGCRHCSSQPGADE